MALPCLQGSSNPSNSSEFRGCGDWRWRPRALRDKLLLRPAPNHPSSASTNLEPWLVLARHPGEEKVSGVQLERPESIDLLRSSRIRYLYPRRARPRDISDWTRVLLSVYGVYTDRMVGGNCRNFKTIPEPQDFVCWPLIYGRGNEGA